MNDKEVKSFDTVDLLAPMDLIPIQGIESPALKVETESKQEANTKTEKSTWDNVSKHVNEGTNGYYQDFGNDQNLEYHNNRNSSRQYRNLNIDPEKIFREEEALRNNLDRQKTKKNIFVIMIFAFIICFIALLSIMKGAKDRIAERDKNKFANDAVSEVEDIEKTDTYGIMEMNANELNSEFVTFEKEIIEHSSVLDRSLYFKATPKTDNVVITLTVEMIDSYGNTIEKAVGSTSNIPKGGKGLVKVSFEKYISQDILGVSYKITCDSYALEGAPFASIIVGSKEDENYIFVTKEGGNFANKDAYIIFYKDGAISYIMFNSNYLDNSDDPENKDHAVIYFYTRYVDYDSYEIYY